MTDKLPLLTTQAADSSQANLPGPVVAAAAAAAAATAPNDGVHNVEATEEEPYTIKCICKFKGDDGNTIYCETCDTWQHIDCFYPDNREEAIREDFAHSCAECNPRPLNRQKAIERILQLGNSRSESDNADKKNKRPPSKSHKKKSKPADGPLNGHHGIVDGGKHANSNDHHSSKKSKTSHRPSLSINSQSRKRSPSYGHTRPNPTHPPSPATTPPDLPDDFQIHHYSAGFYSLYNELDVPDTHNNAFASLAIPTALSRWLREPDAMKQEVGRTHSEVFQDDGSLPHDGQPKLEVKDTTRSINPSTILRWRFVKSAVPIDKDVPLIELNGEIGFQKDYCANPDNLWADISSPLPFVFFHPVLPLYIDTRKEGSLARYVRRSCKPNAQLDTYLTDGSEYHFWLVSDRYIPAHEQITLPWDFRLEKSVCSRWLHLLGLSEDDGAAQDEFDLEESEYTAISNWIDRILSEYGGCACNLDNNCAFARFHRHYLYGRSQARNAKRRHRKTKTYTVSPTDTSHATSNSRSASEGRFDDISEKDGKGDNSSNHNNHNNSNNTPSRSSKPPVEDRVPPRQGSFDQLGILTEPTDRDKRKVAMVEDSFRRMEQQQPPKKKKRAPDGPSPAAPRSRSKNSSGQATGTYIDAGTSSSKSNSPVSLRSPNPGHSPNASKARQGSASLCWQPSAPSPRSTYCHAGTQTDPVEGEWFSEPSKSNFHPKRIISLSRRLLNYRPRIQSGLQHSLSVSSQSPRGDAAVIEFPAAGQAMEILKPILEEVVVMPPADEEDVDMTIGSPTVVAPSPAYDKIQGQIEDKTPDLRLETSQIPFLEISGGSESKSTTSLSTTTSPVAPMAVSNNASNPQPSAASGPAVNPSPVKRKLTLSDYTKRNKSAIKPSVVYGTTKSSSIEDIKVETPADSMAGDKTAGAPLASMNAAPTNGTRQE